MCAAEDRPAPGPERGPDPEPGPGRGFGVGPARLAVARLVLAELPRAYEATVYGRVKFRVGSIVFTAFSRELDRVGLAFPREEREWLIAAEPDKFLLPRPSDLRFQWIEARLDALDDEELAELVVDGWRMVVPKKVIAAYDLRHPPA